MVGLYSATYNSAGHIFSVVTVGLLRALRPIYLKMWVDTNPEETSAFLSQGLSIYALIVLFLAAFLAATSHEVVLILAGESFVEGAPILPIILTGMLLSGSVQILGASFYIHGNTRYVLFSVYVALGTNVALNLVLIPIIGLYGAAVATAVSYLVQVLLVNYWRDKSIRIIADLRLIVIAATASA